jgi:hypothetical protein
VSYSARVHRLLVSAPGDILTDDLRTVERRVQTWTATYGESFGAVVVPLHWRSAAAAAHGDRPQAALNAQLVDSADAVLALFWGRIGTPTGEAPSGTIDELERALDNGKVVGILRCKRPYPPDVDTKQLRDLRDWLDENRSRSLVLDYESGEALSQHVEQFLTRVVSQRDAEDRIAFVASDSTAATDLASAASVWPRVESEDRVRTDSNGRVRSTRNHYLMLSNTGNAPALNVTFRLEAEGTQGPGEVPIVHEGDTVIESLAPGASVRLILLLHTGPASQTRCVVEWTDDIGTHENVATLRFY